MSFTAISTLVCLEDDLSRLDKSGIISGTRLLDTGLLAFSEYMRNDQCNYYKSTRIHDQHCSSS